LKQVTKRTLLIFGTGIIIIVLALMVGNGIYSSTVDSATKHMATGKQLRLEGRRDEAAAKFQRAVSVDPRNSEAWYYLAMTYEELGRNRESLDAWKKYVELARGRPEEDFDVKFALSHIDALEHPEKYAAPPPQPLPAELKPYDLNRDERLDGFDWNGLNDAQQTGLLMALGIPPERTDHVRNRVDHFYTSDRVARRLLNLNEDIYSTDPNIKVTDVVDQYIVMSDYLKMTPAQKEAFLIRNKVRTEDIGEVLGIFAGDKAAIAANIRARDEVYYLLDWGLFSRDYKVKFMTQIGIATNEAADLVTAMDKFYQDPTLRYLRIDEVYRKLR
jgi:tetratricopeptide (TPR) repeat protein